MLPAALGRYRRHRPLDYLQHRLLHAFARHHLRVDSFVMIMDRDRQDLLGPLLSDHILVKHPLDFSGLGHRGALAESFFAVSLLGDYVVTKIYAFVTDINRRAGNQLANLVLALSAKGANQVARTVIMLGHHCLPQITWRASG